MNEWVRQFVRAVRAGLPVRGRSERQFLRELRAQLEDAFAHRPPASVEEVSAQIGTPEEVVGSYLFQLDPDDLARRIRRAKRWRRTLVCVLLVLFLVGGLCFCVLSHGYFAFAKTIDEGTGYFVDLSEGIE